MFHGIFDSSSQKVEGSMFGSAFGGAQAPLDGAANDIKVDLPVTLQEFYHGCIKVVEYTKNTLALDGHTLRDDLPAVMKTVIVKPGQAPGLVFKFKGEGHQQYKREPTDLIVTLVEGRSDSDSEAVKATHRHGNDLIYTCPVTLQQALRAEPAIVHTLDGRLIKLPLDSVITPKTMIKVEGEGMTIVPPASQRVDPLDPPKRGDMYVRFSIKFPKALSDAQKTRLAAVLAH